MVVGVFNFVSILYSTVSLDNLRIPGVLQRLAWSYLVVASLDLLVARGHLDILTTVSQKLYFTIIIKHLFIFWKKTSLLFCNCYWGLSVFQDAWWSPCLDVLLYWPAWLCVLLLELVWLCLTFLLPVPDCPTWVIYDFSAAILNCSGFLLNNRWGNVFPKQSIHLMTPPLSFQ